MLVSQWMARNLIIVDPTTPILHAKYLVGEREIRHLPVVVGGVLVGILTDSDLREFAPSRATAFDPEHAHIEIDELLAGDVMTRQPLTVKPTDSIAHAAEIMSSQKIGALPVIDDNNTLVGIITETDLFRALIHLSRESDIPTAA